MKLEQIATLLREPLNWVQRNLEADPFKEITTCEQAEKAYFDGNAHPDSCERREVMLKWLSLCATREQAKEAYNKAFARSEPKRLALVKWLSFCTTCEQAEEAYNKVPKDSEFERLAMLKWLSLCIAPGQAKEVFRKVSEGRESKRLALVRWEELCLEEAQKAITREQLAEVYEKAPAGTEVQKVIIRKLAVMPDEEEE